ncbi:carbohydrate sulfotransferase 11-like [Lineus longissimus]|uniref:carbohydrate sulfotransferase 11-like n=1 Tax=Lineus longissimus TaxID=88925 RepID=UPI002B4D3998
MEIPIKQLSGKRGVIGVLVICLPLLCISYHSAQLAVKQQFRVSETLSAAKRQLIPDKKGDTKNQEIIISERVKAMNDYCNTLDQQILQKTVHGKNSPYFHLYVDDKHKFIFCTIAKVACSNWKRLMLGLAGLKDPFRRRSIHVHDDPELLHMKLLSYSPNEIEYRLKHYTKAILVRHPLERTISAYRNKFNESSGRTPSSRIYRPKIIRKYRPDLPEKAIREGARVTFQEFVRYLTHPLDFPELEPWDHMNVHWEPYITSCDPCAVRYDIVAKYETLDEDVSFILNKINASDMIRWPKRSEYYNKIPTSQIVSEALKDISSENLKALNAIYYHDYKMFGYEFQEKEY